MNQRTIESRALGARLSILPAPEGCVIRIEERIGEGDYALVKELRQTEREQYGKDRGSKLSVEGSVYGSGATQLFELWLQPASGMRCCLEFYTDGREPRDGLIVRGVDDWVEV